VIFKELPDENPSHARRSNAPSTPFLPSFHWDTDELRVRAYPRPQRRGAHRSDQSSRGLLASLALLLSWGFK
jgi:hypothetical protein